ncbi:uncharacterized protein BT62DRAFT_900467 [Guyanagaster necrorhizus]|uniref:LysM domain-containing protein n=1 Tax=Guyanagaster necrorhizus TaxID=856835 RepID=A0A9P7VP82_9AGAR|nr:uncharacterized protein BT62DRAFT_900467 [Guyanagaster necrorhizus MCA 3950]KAG7444175.1 hypothetical protein BT62DRAFT_900467 [Guyanagaster necrorhizus MCA 3950]
MPCHLSPGSLPVPTKLHSHVHPHWSRSPLHHEILLQCLQVANCVRNYTVQLGDTCDPILAAQNSSSFPRFPCLRECILSSLFLKVLCLGIVGQDCTDTYVVASEDSCVAIAAADGTTYDILLANNPNVVSTCANIYPGEESLGYGVVIYVELTIYRSCASHLKMYMCNTDEIRNSSSWPLLSITGITNFPNG